MEEETIFEKILKKEIACQLVYEDEFVIGFHDVNPQAPVHVLVIPKQKIVSFKNLSECDANLIGEYVKRVSLVAKKLGLNKDGYRVVFNHGKNGGQTVDYIHAHILGERKMEWPPG